MTAVLGQIVSDGTGGLSGSWTMSVNGTISNGSFDGSYNIAANCTGTLTFATEDTTNAYFDIVLDDTHKGFQMIQADPGFAQSGFGLAQGLAACGLTGVRRTFTTNFLGTLFPGLEIEGDSGAAKVGRTRKHYERHRNIQRRWRDHDQCRQRHLYGRKQLPGHGTDHLGSGHDELPHGSRE
jgi:hypothetical protein